MIHSEDLPPLRDAGLFGFEYDPERTHIAIIGVPWEPTVSYGRGTKDGPLAIVKASHQLDFFDFDRGQDVGPRIGILPINPDWVALNEVTTRAAVKIIDAGGRVTPDLEADLRLVNENSARLNDALRNQVHQLLKQGKRVGILGGDHSSPLGSMLAHVAQFPNMGVLHIDAHADLRIAYEGFIYSHASIMFNLLQKAPQLSALVSVGVRDFSRQEFEMAQMRHNVTTFYDRELQQALYQGQSWDALCRTMVDGLPHEVYVSFDVDGLEPSMCPNTGTPVPGGLTFPQAVHLLEVLVDSGRKVIGFDLCEVAPGGQDEWDANVGARLLHKLCGLLDE